MRGNFVQMRNPVTTYFFIYLKASELLTLYSILFEILINMSNVHVCRQFGVDQNMLKLNLSKTAFVIIGNVTQHKKIAHIFPVELLRQKQVL